MYSRKFSSKNQKERSVEQILCILAQNESGSQGQTKKMRVKAIFQDQHLDEYFVDLWRYISGKNVENFKRYECLADGLYILMKGEINYLALDTKKQPSNERKMLKTASRLSSSTSINQPFSIFTCTSRNCSSIENSVLLRISEDQANQCSFYELFNRKEKLYREHYLTTDHLQLFPFTKTSEIFHTDSNIHSTFHFKTFIFRNLIKLASVGIVSKGRIKLKEKFHTFQFDKNGVLLPKLVYEVISHEAEILIIQNNETLTFSDYYTPRIEVEQVIKFPMYQKSIDKALSVSKKPHNLVVYRQQQTQTYSKREFIKRQRDIAKLSKQSEQYSIISTYLCRKSLQFAKKQNLKNETHEKKEERYRNPLVLFKVTNQKSKISIPSFCQSEQQNKQNQSKKLNTFHHQTKKILSIQPSDIILKK